MSETDEDRGMQGLETWVRMARLRVETLGYSYKSRCRGWLAHGHNERRCIYFIKEAPFAASLSGGSVYHGRRSQYWITDVGNHPQG